MLTDSCLPFSKLITRILCTCTIVFLRLIVEARNLGIEHKVPTEEDQEVGNIAQISRILESRLK